MMTQIHAQGSTADTMFSTPVARGLLRRNGLSPGTARRTSSSWDGAKVGADHHSHSSDAGFSPTTATAQEGFRSPSLPFTLRRLTFEGSRFGHNFGDVSVTPKGANRTDGATNEMDGGVPDAGPRDAAPIAGVPTPPNAGAPTGPAGTPPPPAPAGGPPAGGTAPAAAPSATFGPVQFDTRAKRIPPTRSVNVPVTISNLPAGGSAVIDVEGSGGANGTATITAGASQTSSGTVTVRGDTQTTPGNAGGLRLRARVAGGVVGTSAGFSVAAWPTDFTISRNSDPFSASVVGILVNLSCISDGSGALSELSEVDHSEQVDIGSRDNPPFTTVGAVTGGPGLTSGFMAATSTGMIDGHRYARADIDLSTVGAGTYRLVYRQNFIFNDRRTGVTNQVVRNSGFTISHVIVVVGSGAVAGRAYFAQKIGAAVTAVGRPATAGSGTATSDIHTL